MELEAWDILKLWLKQPGEIPCSGVKYAKYAENTAVVLSIFLQFDG